MTHGLDHLKDGDNRIRPDPMGIEIGRAAQLRSGHVIAGVSHPRRLWFRHSMRAGGWTLGLLASLVAAIALGGHGDATLVLAGMGVGLACLALGRREHRLARRARIGEHSERRVRAALSALERAGWTVRHSVLWPQSGDIDHIVTAPTGAAFVIETKTRGFSPAHLARTRACARWVTHRRRRWAPSGATPVLCVVRGGSRCVVIDGVLVAPVDWLAGLLRSIADTQGAHAAGPWAELSALIRSRSMRRGIRALCSAASSSGPAGEHADPAPEGRIVEAGVV